jgi:hypothetical protein
LANSGVNGRALRVQNIRSLQKDFNNTISRLTSQQETEAAGQPASEENTTSDCDTTEQEDPHESDLVLLQVQQMLLPLLLKEEYLNTDFFLPTWTRQLLELPFIRL